MENKKKKSQDVMGTYLLSDIIIFVTDNVIISIASQNLWEFFK